MLHLAARHPFARLLVNSGRLSVPSVYDGFQGFGPDALPGPARPRPGAPCPDAPLGVTATTLPLADTQMGLDQRARYVGDSARAVYLIRPDRQVAARWPDFEPAQISAALTHALEKAAPTMPKAPPSTPV